MNGKVYTLPKNARERRQTTINTSEALLVVHASDAPINLGLGQIESKSERSSYISSRKQTVDTENNSTEVSDESTENESVLTRGARSIVAYNMRNLILGVDARRYTHVSYGTPQYETVSVTFGALANLNIAELGIAYHPKVNLNIDDLGEQQEPASVLIHGRSFVKPRMIIGGLFKQTYASAIESELGTGQTLGLYGEAQGAPIATELFFTYDKSKIALPNLGFIEQTSTKINLRLSFNLGGPNLHLDYQVLVAGLSGSGNSGKTTGSSYMLGLGWLRP